MKAQDKYKRSKTDQIKIYKRLSGFYSLKMMEYEYEIDPR